MKKMIFLLLVLSLCLQLVPISAENAPAFSGYCTWTGEWQVSGSVKGPFTQAEKTLWINGVGSEATVTYYPEITYPTDVQIDVFLLYWHENLYNQVKYEVHHNGKVDTFVLDPTKQTESSWVTLGTFDFSGSLDKEYVKLICMTKSGMGGNTRASALRFKTNTETFHVAPEYTIENALEGADLAPLNRFSDMKDHWAHYDVEYMANEGLVSGKAESLYDPEAQITYAEYITILVRAMGYEVAQTSNGDAWYTPYITSATQNGLFDGFPTVSIFNPELPITREDMAFFTYNAIKATQKNDEWVSAMPDNWANYADNTQVSDYAKNVLHYLIQTGIIKGTTDTTVSPKETATRAQAAVILKRFMQQFVWAGPPKNNEWVLTFQDEFSGDSLDWGIWRSEATYPSHILSSRWPENVSVKDGNLYLHTKKEKVAGAEWTSGNVWVRPEYFRQSYGYFEARYKYAPASGLNNAFWITTQSLSLPREKHYELDINEGHFPNEINTNYHARYGGNDESKGEIDKSEYDLSADFHTYGIEWKEDVLYYYFDGEVVATKENNTKGLHADVPIVPTLSTAVLEWAGPILDDLDGTAMVVDYVRVWQTKEDADNPERTIKGTRMENVSPAAKAPGAIETDMSILKQVKQVTVEEQTIDNTTYPGEIIVSYETEGDWSKSTAIPNYDGGFHLWSSTPNSVVRYPLKNVPSGKYDIYIWRTPHEFNARQMDMILTQNGQNDLCGSVALKLQSGKTAAPGWIKLGTHQITDQNGYIYYISDGTNCRATGVKFVPVK